MLNRRNVKVRAYYNAVTTAGNVEAARCGAPFPIMTEGDEFEGMVATYQTSDCNYVRLDLPGVYDSSEAADDAASLTLQRVVTKLCLRPE